MQPVVTSETDAPIDTDVAPLERAAENGVAVNGEAILPPPPPIVSVTVIERPGCDRAPMPHASICSIVAMTLS